MDENMQLFLKEIDEYFNKIREERSYKVAGVPNAALKVKCAICGKEIEFAHCVYDLHQHKIVCYECYEQKLSDAEDYSEWINDFTYDSYF